MTNEERVLLLRRQVLLALNDCVSGASAYLLSESVLHSHLAITMNPAPTLFEMKQQLSFLESNSLVVGIRPELGGSLKWKITDAGRAALV